MLTHPEISTKASGLVQGRESPGWFNGMSQLFSTAQILSQPETGFLEIPGFPFGQML